MPNYSRTGKDDSTHTKGFVKKSNNLRNIAYSHFVAKHFNTLADSYLPFQYDTSIVVKHFVTISKVVN
ncbi:hypothetical protein Hanom_Chr05g00428851 [Helianthus anomalus]